jgi:hypothetical protein
MLAHATILWPEIISDELWPFALKMAVDVHNTTPGSSGLSPTEIFSGQKSSRCRLRDFHPFGCPVFVLEASLQNGHKIPKWKPRSRMAIYLGNSPDHATSVPLVLNTSTGLVSPQYHMVFDDSFTTTKCLDTDKIPSNWTDLFKTSEVNLLEPDQEVHHKLDSSLHEPTIESLNARPHRPFSSFRFVDEFERDESVESISEPINSDSPFDFPDAPDDEDILPSSAEESTIQESLPPPIRASTLRKNTFTSPKAPII